LCERFLYYFFLGAYVKRKTAVIRQGFVYCLGLVREIIIELKEREREMYSSIFVNMFV